ncbi:MULTISPECIES: D-aminoacyl-tRNA deacylase [Dermacoccus]|jgi:D-tyrosyl-tRNA(Tyr) deacylase|uniref:D-aminoacyl-tRNA deacylase n=1 Tax=Dermacoccus abyssi TaxID=322596 RepID=A0ABX5ZBC2_9MICO|nr:MULTISPECIES: D-aminoacyl-tRNA deacylase [Dermacoccus]MBE7371373.1 D-tyrosyl-tRNA(Tyr) deacylase [Dermacoccus barathri]MBZ4498919.1 D-tyrosyl-tRNA(Tyr) deacylase [Dermacoccus sp. Tok2021]QEH94013.1 D-tyrosyl-tRNA(Tyr) deacylase [Dermacoccus abyssi]
MRAVVQRALEASVTVDGEVVGALPGPGLVALVGVTHDDGDAQVEAMARKIAGLRIMPGEVSVSDLTERGESTGVLVVSQFTLYGDVRKGRRPSWGQAAPGDVAEPLVDALADALVASGIAVETGRFGADMKVALTNDGPFTVIIDV